VLGVAAWGQTILINPLTDGGFESGTTFAANNWNVSNSANNPWVVGTAVSSGAITGKSAYISNDGGVSNAYSNGSYANNFFWRDVTVPAGELKITLSFNWICQGESTWDNWQVFTAPTSVVPAGTTTYPGSGSANVPAAITGATFVGNGNLQGTVQTATFTLPPSLAGTTFRLIFSWKDDNSGGTQPPAVIDNISLVSRAPGNFISIVTGNWSAPSTWDVNLVPTVYDTVTVSTSNVVTIDQTGQTAYNTIVNGTLAFASTPTVFTAANNLTVNTGGIVNAFNGTTGKNLTVGGNLVNNGMIDLSVGTSTSTSTLTLNGTAVQTVSGSGTFNTGVIRNLTFNNTSTAIPNINWNFNNISVGGNLTFTSGKVNLGSNKMTLGTGTTSGTGASSVGSLTAPAGTGFMPGGTFSRWWTSGSTGTSITAGTDPTNSTSRYPFLNATGQNRAMYITRNTPTAGGQLSVKYNNATTTSAVTITDGAYTVQTRYDGNWVVSTEGTGIAATDYGAYLLAPGAYIFPAANGNSRIVSASAAISGTHQNGTSTPGAYRTGVSLADLTNAGGLYMGINNADLIMPCSGTPTGGTTTSTLNPVCASVSFTLGITGSTTGVTGITYQWQSSPDNITYNNIGGATSSTLTTTETASTYYQCVVTCSASGLSMPSAPLLVNANTPTYATIPYTETFESSWINGCGTKDIPTNNWRNSPLTGNNSWRRQDEGSTAGWSSSSGIVTPSGSTGAANFHSFNASSGTVGTLDMYVNLSTASPVTLKFNYQNSSGTDQMQVFLSTDGGATFGSALGTYTTGTWALTTINLGVVGSATSVIRFKATSDFGGSDIGIDNVNIALTPTCIAPTAVTVTPTAPTTATVAWTCTACTGNFIVEYGPAGFTPGTGSTAGTGGTIASVTAVSPYNLTGLPASTTSDIYVRQDCGGSGFGANASLVQFIPGDVCANAIDLGTLTSPLSSTTVGANNDYSSPCASGNASPDLVYYIQVPNLYTLVVGQTVNAYDSENTLFYGGSCPGTTQIACFDDPDVQNFTWQNTTGTTQTVYWVQDGYFDNSNAGTFTLAWSLTAPVYDVGVAALVSPTAPSCFGSTETVSVSVKNFGTTTVDFTTMPVTVSGSTTGPNPVTFTPVVLSTGTLAAGASQTVTFATASYDMSAAGTYVFNASTSMTGDGLSSNDALSGASLIKTAPTVTASSDVTICSGASTTLTATAGSTPPPVSGTNSTAMAIPDNNAAGVSSTINISGAGGASSVASVTLNITHTFDGDLDITLIAPNGSSIDLTSDNGGLGDDYTGTVFVPTGAPSITTGTAPMTGTFTPEQAFTTLTGSANGTWTLKVADDASIDTGTLLNWSITIPGAAAPASYAWTPATGLSSSTISNPVANPTSTTTYSVVMTDQSGCTATDDVMVTVNPTPVVSAVITTPIACNGGTATVTVSATGGTPAYTGTGPFTGVAPGPQSYTVTDANSCSSTATVTVTQPAAITVTTSSTPILCNGGSSSVTVSATGGTGTLTGTGTFSQVAGTTVYTVTDANGCTGTASVTVTQPTALVVSSSQTSILCNGGSSSVTISASGGTPSYSGTGTFPQVAGTTTYTVTDANACPATVSVVVTQPAVLSATVSSTGIACFGGDATVNIVGAGGTAPYTGTGPFTQNAAAGTVTYTLTDANGCSTTVTNTETDPAELFIGTGATSVMCNGDSATVTVTSFGGTGTVTGTGNFPQAAGTVTYTITDANGCTASSSVTVTQPSAVAVTAASGTILCNGGSATVTVSATGGTPAYTGEGTFTQFAGTTVYTVTDANGCTGTASTTLTEPTAVMVMFSSTPVLCNGDSSSVMITGMDGTPGYTGEGTFMQAAGTTTYTITDANGCTGSANVTVTQPAAIATTQNADLCAGQSITVGANTYNTAGTYVDVLSAANSCDSTVTTVVTNVIVDATTSTSGATITANSTTGTFQWLDCNAGMAPIAGETNQSFTAATDGSYAVQVTDNGCVDTSACVVIIGTGLNNSSAATMNVYPNPTSGIFNLSFANANFSELLISIVDVQGKLVYSSSEKNVNGAYNKVINLEELSKGLYYIKVTTGTDVKIQKLTIQ
jgi:subtilisin-like proprotein convertase family protein